MTTVLHEDLRVDYPPRPDRFDPLRVLTLVDGDQAGQAALDRLLVDDVGGSEAVLRPGRADVVNLYRQRRSGWNSTWWRGLPGKRALPQL